MLHKQLLFSELYQIQGFLVNMQMVEIYNFSEN